MATLIPTGGFTGCTVETGSFPVTYDGAVITGACFKQDQSCLSEWYWDTPVYVTNFWIASFNYHLYSTITEMWGRVDGIWVQLWSGTWHPANGDWASIAANCDNCTGIRIIQLHSPQGDNPCIFEVEIEYDAPPSCSDYNNQSECRAAGCFWWDDMCWEPMCGWIKTQEDCEANGCYWWESTQDCHATLPEECSDYTNLGDCLAANCYWYNGSCHGTRPPCEDFTNEPDCTRNDCWWYNGSCHTNAPICEQINTEPECTYPCYWYNGSCHSSLVCSAINNQSDCNDNNCYWYNGSCHSEPGYCEIYNTQAECEYAYGCYWYDGSCHTDPQVLCSDYTTQTECETNGCYWCDGACQAQECDVICSDYTTQTDCEANNCYWYDDACHSTEEGKVCSDYTTEATCPEGCFWYKKYLWEEEKCHSEEQNMMMDYLPFIIAGAGGVLIVAALVMRGKPAPQYYPQPPMQPK